MPPPTLKSKKKRTVRYPPTLIRKIIRERWIELVPLHVLCQRYGDECIERTDLKSKLPISVLADAKECIAFAKHEIENGRAGDEFDRGFISYEVECDLRKFGHSPSTMKKLTTAIKQIYKEYTEGQENGRHQE